MPPTAKLETRPQISPDLARYIQSHQQLEQDAKNKVCEQIESGTVPACICRRQDPKGCPGCLGRWFTTQREDCPDIIVNDPIFIHISDEIRSHLRIIDNIFDKIPRSRTISANKRLAKWTWSKVADKDFSLQSSFLRRLLHPPPDFNVHSLSTWRLIECLLSPTRDALMVLGGSTSLPALMTHVDAFQHPFASYSSHVNRGETVLQRFLRIPCIDMPSTLDLALHDSSFWKFMRLFDRSMCQSTTPLEPNLSIRVDRKTIKTGPDTHMGANYHFQLIAPPPFFVLKFRDKKTNRIPSYMTWNSAGLKLRDVEQRPVRYNLSVVWIKSTTGLTIRYAAQDGPCNDSQDLLPAYTTLASAGDSSSAEDRSQQVYTTFHAHCPWFSTLKDDEFYVRAGYRRAEGMDREEDMVEEEDDPEVLGQVLGEDEEEEEYPEETQEEAEWPRLDLERELQEMREQGEHVAELEQEVPEPLDTETGPIDSTRADSIQYETPSDRGMPRVNVSKRRRTRPPTPVIASAGNRGSGNEETGDRKVVDQEIGDQATGNRETTDVENTIPITSAVSLSPVSLSPVS